MHRDLDLAIFAGRHRDHLGIGWCPFNRSADGRSILRHCVSFPLYSHLCSDLCQTGERRGSDPALPTISCSAEPRIEFEGNPDVAEGSPGISGAWLRRLLLNDSVTRIGYRLALRFLRVRDSALYGHEL